jgi:hypothetical protein
MPVLAARMLDPAFRLRHALRALEIGEAFGGGLGEPSARCRNGSPTLFPVCA